LPTSKAAGDFHHQADAEWIVIRRPLRGHDDTPYGRPTAGRPIDLLATVGVFGVFDFPTLSACPWNSPALSSARSGYDVRGLIRQMEAASLRHGDAAPISASALHFEPNTLNPNFVHSGPAGAVGRKGAEMGSTVGRNGANRAVRDGPWNGVVRRPACSHPQGVEWRVVGHSEP
jgi:hypothetical protein